MNRPPLLSIAIIAQDEAPRLAELLSALTWADEIVVVDGGSRDATPSIALQHGCRLVSRPFDNFASQRNFAMQACRGKWVLSLDADEMPTAALIDELLAVLATPQFDAYRVPIRSRIFGRRIRFSGTQDDCPIRLVRRGGGRWSGAVHESLVVAGCVGRLRGHLSHRSLDDLETFLAKMHRYTRLAATQRVAAREAPQRHERWYRPVREAARRLIWKQGWLDGPTGWAFCFLSGLSEWVLADQHRRLWPANPRHAKH